MLPRPSRSRRLAVAALSAATLVGLLADGGTAVASPRPTPPTPVQVTTQDQLNAARGARNAVAAQVGTLSAQLAEMDNQIQLLNAKKEMAEQKFALAVSQLQQAQQAERAATARLGRCRQAVAGAKGQFVDTIRARYMSGDPGGMAGTLLTAQDPSVVLEQSTLDQYLSAHKADAIGRYQQLLVACSNDQVASTRARLAREKAEKDAASARAAAFAAVAQAQREQAALATARAAKQRELDQKQSEFFATAAERTKYLNYRKAYANYVTAKQAWDEHQAELAREAAARQRARERARHHGGGHSGGGGGGGSWSLPPPSSGGWSRAAGRRAVARARDELGIPYAWAGGGVGGPSYGVCDSSNGAPNDCNVRGFDCSGLAMFAWGRYWAHYAATQYTEAGSYHPSLGDLLPGDLLFWSFNGRISGIHHVAIYIGGGQIIQAPESGSYVMVSSMYDPGSIFGATRPLT